MEEIFEVFGQIKQPLDRAKGGMGLGLAPPRRLAEWHGGSLCAESGGGGQGSDFMLTLVTANEPIRPSAPQPGGPLSPLDIVIVETTLMQQTLSVFITSYLGIPLGSLIGRKTRWQ